MTLRIWNRIAVAVASLLISACAQTSAEPRKVVPLTERLAERGYSIGETVDRIPDYRVDGWYYVDSEHIILNGGVTRRYLVTLMSPCSDLSSQEDIGFTSTTSALTRMDKLVVRSVIGPRDCPIKEIHALKAVDGG